METDGKHEQNKRKDGTDLNDIDQEILVNVRCENLFFKQIYQISFRVELKIRITSTMILKV